MEKAGLTIHDGCAWPSASAMRKYSPPRSWQRSLANHAKPSSFSVASTIFRPATHCSPVCSTSWVFCPRAHTNRLGLAKWLTSRDQPVVARVLVNRIWQRVFGEGLVRTPEDFGLQGEQPTHPELLDWLAVELQDSNWDLKHMLRLMVRSETFRQSSALRPALNDPENKLFARGPLPC